MMEDGLGASYRPADFVIYKVAVRLRREHPLPCHTVISFY